DPEITEQCGNMWLHVGEDGRTIQHHSDNYWNALRGGPTDHRQRGIVVLEIQVSLMLDGTEGIVGMRCLERRGSTDHRELRFRQRTGHCESRHARGLR